MDETAKTSVWVSQAATGQLQVAGEDRTSAEVCPEAAGGEVSDHCMHQEAGTGGRGGKVQS